MLEDIDLIVLQKAYEKYVKYIKKHKEDCLSDFYAKIQKSNPFLSYLLDDYIEFYQKEKKTPRHQCFMTGVMYMYFLMSVRPRVKYPYPFPASNN